MLVDLVACVSQSAFLPKENKDKLLKYLDDYLKALAMSTEDGNFISSTLRGIIGIFYDVHSHDYDELNKKYENYKKSKSSGNDTSTSKIKNKLVKAGEWLTANLFGLRNAERRRFFSMSEALENPLSPLTSTSSFVLAVSTVTHQTRSTPFDGAGETRSCPAVRCVACTDAPAIVTGRNLTLESELAPKPMSSGSL